MRTPSALNIIFYSVISSWGKRTDTEVAHMSLENYKYIYTEIQLTWKVIRITEAIKMHYFLTLF